MKKIVLAVCIASLAGCMASESVQQRQPVFTAETTKTAEVYSNCVHERWAELTVGAERFTRPDGYRVRNLAGGLLDVTSTATGAHVEMREPPLSAWSPEDAAKACL
ncbi:hypothetical protein WL84_18620 [Burkholderia cenocepacia]|uniref:hypothetical protein n=1 Tax=Burkholderia cenocepacia TaxID=95486 RepID=UPI00076C27F9|nr:hypothetical protein [Burkholderia cenocepacia]KWF22513.1 hypothetical protein WL84_18620 [Burkholderia cenocepacia]MCA8005145.1 hypothetical protein [Burkholderia cenocepacia]